MLSMTIILQKKSSLLNELVFRLERPVWCADASRLVATLSPDEVTPRDLGAYMTGAALQNGGAA